MKKTFITQDQVFWYLQRPATHCLRENLETEIAIIGGGMAGLTAAQSFAKKGKKVTLLEAYYCGAGASGKSSGFITPNSEISLSEFISRYGMAGGKAIWKSIETGAEHIRKNISEYNIECDYIIEDSLEVANSKSSLKKMIAEYKNLEKLGYKSTCISKENLSKLIGSQEYYGGITYENTFGINAYKYCKQMKKILSNQGVLIYEETPVLSFDKNSIETLHAQVKADYIIVCTDRFTPYFGKLSQEIYHAQNFLFISQVLTDSEKKYLFPDRNLMVWDSDLIYNYYRISDNRLLLGGGSLLSTYDLHERHHSNYIYKKMTNYFKKKFPQIDLQFEQTWPGLIGISKDIAPLSGRDKDNHSVYYIAACAGLPIAAGLGIYCADHIIDGHDELKDYFSAYRKFPISGFLEKILGVRLSFALSNLIKLNVP
jgi:gamma-glutamylputrescine oxidase